MHEEFHLCIMHPEAIFFDKAMGAMTPKQESKQELVIYTYILTINVLLILQVREFFFAGYFFFLRE